MESGHNKNVANLETVIIILTSLGAEYAPTQALITLVALQGLLAQAQTVLADVDEAQANLTVKVDAAQAEFKDLAKYVRNIKNNAVVVLNDPAFTKDLQTIVNKFSPPGRKTGLTDDPNTPEDESRTSQSQSQQSRDNQIAYLADISALLKLREDYVTPETAYTTEAIDNKIASLTAVNNAAKAAIAALGNKLDARNALLYDKTTGIKARVNLIKPYIALKFGKDSAVYQQINALEFKQY
jgi:aspartokinase